LGVLGALVVSSGVALMVTATPANANQGLSVCHPVNGAGETGNGWVVFGPDHASSHIDESLYPDGHYWMHTTSDGRHDVYASENGTCPGAPVEQTRCPDDATAHAGEVVPEGEDPATYCVAEVTSPETCPDDATANAGVEIPVGADPNVFCNAVVSSPEVCPDDATAHAGDEIPTGQSPEEFCTATVVVSPPGGTTVVSPPKANTPKAHTPKAHTPKAATVTPTVVHAGLAGVSAQDLRGEQGLALMVAGMVMLVAAGGLGLRLRGAASRI